MLCCIFNYAPLYRKSIYRQIDEKYDTQFYFGREPIEGKKSGIKKMDYALFKHRPKEIKNKLLLGKLLWRTHIVFLPCKRKYSTFILTGDLSFSYIPFIVLCKLFHKKVYGWGHGLKSLRGRFCRLTKFVFWNYDGYFTYGEKGKERMIELGYRKEKLHVIYNSLESATPANQQNLVSTIYRDHFQNKQPVIIFIGRLTPVKKLDWIIRAMSGHKKEGVCYNLMIIGTGTEENGLKELVHGLDLDNNVWFYGECYEDKQLNELLYNADLCVSPGNVGLTAIHCLEYGVPVLSHDDFEHQMPEYEVIVEGETGTLYKYGDFNDFQHKIMQWITSKRDREMIRQNCYQIINKSYCSAYQIKLLRKVLGGQV